MDLAICLLQNNLYPFCMFKSEIQKVRYSCPSPCPKFRYSCIRSEPSHWTEVSSQLFHTCFTPGERPSLLIDRRLGGPVASPNVLERRKSFALVGNQTPDYPVRSLATTFATLTPVRGTAVLNITVTLKAPCTF